MFSLFFPFHIMPELWQKPVCQLYYIHIDCPEVQFVNTSIDIDAGIEWRKQAIFNPNISVEERFYAASFLFDMHLNSLIPYEKCQKFYCAKPPKTLQADGGFIENYYFPPSSQ